MKRRGAKGKGVLGVLKAHRRPLFIDRNLPRWFVQGLRASHWNVRFADEELPPTATDEDVRLRARNPHAILVTTDQDFYWNDRRHPLTATGGLVVLRTAPQDVERVFTKFSRFLVLFPLYDWSNAKVLATGHGFRMKRLGRRGEMVFEWANDGSPILVASWT